MSVHVTVETQVTANGHTFQTVKIQGGCYTLVSHQLSISPGDKDPGIAEVATQALEELEKLAREARQKLAAMRLLVQRPRSEGPYR